MKLKPQSAYLNSAAALLAVTVSGTSALAGGPFGLNLEGSFGEGGFSRYVPPVTNPLFNESPFITTEVKPFYIYHSIPDDFVTDGGDVNVVAIQARIALTERLAFIATTDGYSWIDFDSTLPDDNGFNDIAAGFKYAFYSDPAQGAIATAGLRYTIPVGSLESGGLEFNGVGNGYLNPFVTAAKLWDKTQLQGSFGAQIALSDKNWSFLHGSVHADYEVLPGLFPLLEANLTVPVDGGNQITSGPLKNLTGVDIADIGASNPETTLTLGGGLRFRVSENAILGAGLEYNVLEDKDHLFGWRITTDLVIHF